jgi:hypothetical protein
MKDVNSTCVEGQTQVPHMHSYVLSQHAVEIVVMTQIGTYGKHSISGL